MCKNAAIKENSANGPSHLPAVFDGSCDVWRFYWFLVLVLGVWGGMTEVGCVLKNAAYNV